MSTDKQNVLFSFGPILSFEKKCINLSKDIIESIQKIGKLDLSDKKQSHIRATILVFVQESLHFFVNRSEFIIGIIDRKEIKQEILRNLYRGLIEIYCRILYMNNINDKEKVKRIVWRDLYIVALVCKGQKPSNIPDIVDLNYRLLKENNINFMNFEEFINLVHGSLINFKEERQLKDLKKEFDFPSVRIIIRDYLDEKDEPHISKVDIYYYYSIFSEQIHSNFNLEFSSHKINPKYQLIAWLILFHLRFLREVSNLINQHNQEVESLVAEYNSNVKNQLVNLWHMDKQIKIYAP